MTETLQVDEIALQLAFDDWSDVLCDKTDSLRDD